MKHLFTCLFILFLINTACAQWVSDSTTRNSICTLPNVQNDPQLCTDGNKGAYITWQDYNTSPSKASAQLIDSGGVIQWKTNGIILNDTNFAAFSPQVVTDGKGGVIATWEQGQPSAGDRIYSTHLNKAGTSTWKKSYLPIDTINDDRFLHSIPDGHGGVIIDWYSYIYGTGDPNVIQWLDSTGRPYLPVNGLQVTDPGGAHYSADLVTDNNYHVYVVYYDYDTIRVQRVDTAGKLSWKTGGVVLSTSYHDDGSGHSHQSASDGHGGVIAGWDDNGLNSIVDDLSAQRVDSSGNLLWGATAIIVDSSSSIYSHSFIAVNSDENNGAFFCFGYGHLFLQHVGATGKISWTAAEPITTVTGGQDYPSMDEDGHNGVVACWDDGRSGTPGVYGQEFDTTGARLWGANDAGVYTGANGGVATGSKIISLKNYKAISAIGANGSDIYAARVPNKSLATSILELSDNNQLSIFPNPTSGNLYIKNNSSYSSTNTVQLYNVLGQLIYQQVINLTSYSQQEIITTPGVVKGIYLLKISGNKNKSIFKVIIQ